MASEEGKQHSSRLAANGKYSNQCTAAEIVKCGTEQRPNKRIKGFFPHNTEMESSLEVSLPASLRRALYGQRFLAKIRQHFRCAKEPAYG
jgi:hypothetical protein